MREKKVIGDATSRSTKLTVQCNCGDPHERSRDRYAVPSSEQHRNHDVEGKHGLLEPPWAPPKHHLVKPGMGGGSVTHRHITIRYIDTPSATLQLLEIGLVFGTVRKALSKSPSRQTVMYFSRQISERWQFWDPKSQVLRHSQQQVLHSMLYVCVNLRHAHADTHAQWCPRPTPIAR
jgi:hypothetical protein